MTVQERQRTFHSIKSQISKLFYDTDFDYIINILFIIFNYKPNDDGR